MVFHQLWLKDKNNHANFRFLKLFLNTKLSLFNSKIPNKRDDCFF